jgi:hypothetical protein
VCGKFSQLEDRIVASAAWKSSTMRARDRLERATERLLCGQATGKRQRRTVQTECPSELVPRTELAHHWRRIRKNADAVRSDTPPERELAQVRTGCEHVRGVAQLDVAREPQERCCRAAALLLEFVDVAPDEASAARSFECRIGGELHDVGLPRHRRPHSTAAEHAGRVNNVHLARAVVNERRAAIVSDAHAMVPRHRTHRVRTRGRRCVRSRDDLDLVSATLQELRDIGRMARRPAHVRWPDPGDDQHPHGRTASG